MIWPPRRRRQERRSMFERLFLRTLQQAYHACFNSEHVESCTPRAHHIYAATVSESPRLVSFQLGTARFSPGLLGSVSHRRRFCLAWWHRTWPDSHGAERLRRCRLFQLLILTRHERCLFDRHVCRTERNIGEGGDFLRWVFASTFTCFQQDVMLFSLIHSNPPR